MKKYLLLITLILAVGMASAVTWTVSLVDSYGDGWNGGSLTVYVNDSPALLNITLPNGTGPLDFTFEVFHNDQITTDYIEGSWPYENEYYIYDQIGTLVASQGVGGTVPWDITVPIVVVAPANAPGIPFDPNPANNSFNKPASGTLSWSFGIQTQTYDLWFGPSGSMSQVVSNAAAGASGFYPYTGLTNDTQYSWQVIAYNTNTRLSTSGPVWTFRTQITPGVIQIGAGSSNLNIPIYPYYGYTYSQSIFLQSDIQMPDQRIEKIWYYWNGAQDAAVSNNWVVYMGHTSLTSFGSSSSWIPLANLTQVFAGEVPLPAIAGWIEIQLPSPFIYNNIDNLVVCVDENEPGFNSSSAYFYSTATADNRTLMFYSDDTNPDPGVPPTGLFRMGYPNIRMQFGAMPSGAPLPPTLLFPVAQSGLPQTGFNLSWDPNPSSAPVDYYIVSFWADGQVLGEGPQWETTSTSFDPTQATIDPITYSLGDHWNWAVEAHSNAYPSAGAISTPSWFEIQTGDDVLIGSDAGIGFVPVYPWYTYTYSQSIYLQSEINRANQRIEALQWYWNGNEGISEPNIDIYMGHTPLNDLSGGFLPIGSMQLVYSGPYSVPATPGWIYFPLSIPFIYNNTDNLVIAVHENGGPPNTYYSSLDGFYQSLVPTSRSCYVFNDSAPYDLSSVPVGNPYDYVPNVLLTFNDLPIQPMYQIAPGDWAFGDVQQMNVGVKQYTINNIGAGIIPLTPGSIYIDPASDPEGNFSVVTPGLPANVIIGIPYQFDVVFTPQTLGAKTAILKVEDNLAGTRVLHSYNLTGVGTAEPIPFAVVLNGSVDGANNVNLSWLPTNLTPGGTWIHWDSGDNYDSIGTGGSATFDVAAKFDSADITALGIAGQNLSGVRIWPAVAGATYTVEVWYGDDANLAPTVLVSSTPVVNPIIDDWNEVQISPVPIPSTGALYFGYNVDTTTGYPAGCDAGPHVDGKGNLIQWGGIWYRLHELNSVLTFNWNIQGYAVASTRSTAAPLLSIPVINSNAKVRPPRDLFTANPATVHSNDQRVLQGYMVYRNTLPLTSNPIQDLSYTDFAVPPGYHNYQVQAVYYTGSVWSNIWSTDITTIDPYDLPFSETWDTGLFIAQNWTTSAVNWIIPSFDGDPAPCAAFGWSPTLTNYTEYLTSHAFNGVGHTNVSLSFQMSLNNYSMNAQNWLALEVWNGSTWNTLATWSSFENAGDGWEFRYYSYDISPYAANQLFKIRFTAYGENSYEINYWYIDNINVYSMPSAVAAPVATITEMHPVVLVNWNAVPGATWYAIYGSADPYGTFNYLGYVPATYTGVSFSSYSFGFFKVSAGAGSLPRGPMLENGILSNSK